MSLWLPRSARPSAEPQTFTCRICGTPLTSVEYTAHVRGCYARNEAEVRMSSLREVAPALCGDEGVDVELEQFYRRGRNAA